MIWHKCKVPCDSSSLRFHVPLQRGETGGDMIAFVSESIRLVCFVVVMFLLFYQTTLFVMIFCNIFCNANSISILNILQNV